MANLNIVQGDDKLIWVNFKGELASQVVGFYFSSKSLGVSKYFGEKLFDNWAIDFSSDETKNFIDGVHSFDITAKTIDGETLTGLYQGIVCVKEKVNVFDR